MVRHIAMALCAAVVLGGCTESVHFRSGPESAKVFVNDNFVGLTPMYYSMPRGEVGDKFTYRIEKDAYQPVDGELKTRLAGGRLTGAIFTLGLVYAFRSPYYYPDIDVQLTPAASPLPPASKASPTERLQELERLHQNGLIKESEYERLRAEILRDL